MTCPSCLPVQIPAHVRVGARAYCLEHAEEMRRFVRSKRAVEPVSYEQVYSVAVAR